MKWNPDNGWLVRTFEMSSFVACIEVLNKITPIAEAMNHHPDVMITDYNKLTIRLMTHDKNAITELDHELAKKIDELI